eukprot:12742352-Alexandrium_andersonii.AAC.1
MEQRARSGSAAARLRRGPLGGPMPIAGRRGARAPTCRPAYHHARRSNTWPVCPTPVSAARPGWGPLEAPEATRGHMRPARHHRCHDARQQAASPHPSQPPAEPSAAGMPRPRKGLCRSLPMLCPRVLGICPELEDLRRRL